MINLTSLDLTRVHLPPNIDHQLCGTPFRRRAPHAPCPTFLPAFFSLNYIRYSFWIVCIAWEYFSLVCGRPRYLKGNRALGDAWADRQRNDEWLTFSNSDFLKEKKLFQTISKKGRISKENKKIFKRDTINNIWKMDDLKMELFEEVKLNILKLIWRTYFSSKKFAFAISIRVRYFHVFNISIFSRSFFRWKFVGGINQILHCWPVIFLVF